MMVAMAMTDLDEMLRSLTVDARPEGYVFATVPDESPVVAMAHATIGEREGLTVVVPVSVAETHGLATTPLFAWLTLTVYSSLEAVGLTAAVASALARAGISANMVAGYHHDHVFVPERDADQAVEVLSALSAASAAPSRADTSPGSAASPPRP